MTVSVERIRALICEYQRMGSLVSAKEVLESLQRLIDEEADQMDAYFSSEAKKYNYESND